MKKLPDLDKNHPFYGPEARKGHASLLQRLEKEEKEMVLENRRHYKSKQKGEGSDAD